MRSATTVVPIGSASLRWREARMISSSAGPDRLRQRRALADLAHDGFPGQCAGHFPVLVPAHAIRHQPQAEVAVTVIGVLVQLATQTGVGEVPEFDHAGAVG